MNLNEAAEIISSRFGGIGVGAICEIRKPTNLECEILCVKVGDFTISTFDHVTGDEIDHIVARAEFMSSRKCI